MTDERRLLTLWVCHACGEVTGGAVIDAALRTVRCDRCGRDIAFTPLPPVLFLTGASGAGKTTIFELLVGTVPDAILIDHDVLWGVDPTFDDPSDGYSRFHVLILTVAARIARNGRPVVIDGSCMPENYERLAERDWFSSTRYLAVLCEPDELERRLLARPTWRRSVDAVDSMIAFNSALRALGDAGSIEVVDTTSASVAQSAAEVRAWIEAAAAEWSATTGR